MKTEFVEDIEQLKAHGKSFDLKCPNFSELLEARKKAADERRKPGGTWYCAIASARFLLLPPLRLRAN